MVGFVCVNTGVYADITDGRFGVNQAFDVQYNPAPFTGTVLNASNFRTPFDSAFLPAPLAAGQVYGFLPSPTVPGTYALGIFDSQNNLVRILHNTGDFAALGQDAIFYIGSGFFGTLITTSLGYNLGDADTFTGLTANPTPAALASYAWPSLTPLAAGQSAAPPPPAVSAPGTLLALADNAAAVNSLLALRAASLQSVLSYDSTAFGPNGLSVSFVGRYEVLGDVADEGAGAVVAAYRFAEHFRVGAFVDYAPSSRLPAGLAGETTQPTLGGFAVFEQSADRVGLSARIAGAYSRSTLTITRPTPVARTEPGAGKAEVVGYAFSGELSYGVRLAPGFVLAPHGGLRHTSVTRGDYTEDRTNAVTLPLSYLAFSRRSTTAFGGLKLHWGMGESIEAFIGVGGEYDIEQQTDAYAGWSAAPGLASFWLSTTTGGERLRAAASAGIEYEMAQTQSLYAEISVRQDPYTSESRFASTVRLSVGF